MQWSKHSLPTVAVAPRFAQRLLCGHIAGNRLIQEFPTAGGCSNQTFLLMVPQSDKQRAIPRPGHVIPSLHPPLSEVWIEFNSSLELSWDLSVCARIYFNGTAGKVNTGPTLTGTTITFHSPLSDCLLPLFSPLFVLL